MVRQSIEKIGAGEGNRTLVCSLGNCMVRYSQYWSNNQVNVRVLFPCNSHGLLQMKARRKGFESLTPGFEVCRTQEKVNFDRVRII